MSGDSQNLSLRQRAVRGTIVLTARNILSLGLRIVGLLYLTRIVGAEAYGLFNAVLNPLGYLIFIAEGGMKMYLLRASQDLPEEMFYQAFWWTLCVSLGILTIALPPVLVMGYFGGRGEAFAHVAVALLLCLPVSQVTYVPMAIVERRMEYRSVALIETLYQISFYAIGIPMAWLGFGVWALVSGHWLAQLSNSIGYFVAAKFRPRWFWNRDIIRTIRMESFKLASASLIYELRVLLPSLVLLPLTNEAAMGYYSLAQRLITTLGFVRDAVARLSVPIYARIQEQPDKLLESARLSSLAQMLGLAGLYLPLVLLGVYVLPSIFGSKWDIPSVLLAFSVLAANQLFFVIFGALNQALLVVRQAHVFMKAGGAYVGVSAALSAGLILIAPESYKLFAYVVGVSFAYVPTYYWMMHRNTVRYIAKPRYGMNLVWAAGLGAAMFAPFTHYWSLLGLLVFLHPASLRAAREVKTLLLEARQSKKKGAQASDQNTV